MTIRNWIYERSVSGLPTFSYEEVRTVFVNLSEQVVSNELYRLASQKVVVSPYKKFYVIIPPHYAAKGVVPPYYYIDHLMRYLDKPYYVSLLSAGELLGAAHQRPQQFYVTTIFPSFQSSKRKNSILAWQFRRDVPEPFLQTKNTETGTVKFSSPELTAIDLVQYARSIGGLSRAATVIQELVEVMDVSKITEMILDYTTVSTLQRLGFMLEHVIMEQVMADDLYDVLVRSGKRFGYVALSHYAKCSSDVGRDHRWKILINTQIEMDDL
ncbi:MAG: type IV toxin-antitoxin system AbiEi family antitoxin [Bacteroidales bacterium]|nr:type IV toxin-antitoxin system AbiEi family antitoxin [Bacteroidales bacterium]